MSERIEKFGLNRECLVITHPAVELNDRIDNPGTIVLRFEGATSLRFRESVRDALNGARIGARSVWQWQGNDSLLILAKDAFRDKNAP